MLRSHAAFPVITNPTRVTSTYSTLLDHIYTNISSYKINPYVLEDNLTDHFPVFCQVSEISPKYSSLQKFIRDVKNLDIE